MVGILLRVTNWRTDAKKKRGARGKNVLEEEYKTTYMPYLIPFYCSLCTFPNTSEVHFTSLLLKKKKKRKKRKENMQKESIVHTTMY